MTQSASTTEATVRRMPAEWEPHRATWIAWPHYEEDYPGKLDSIRWVYTEIVRLLGQSELVEILCANEDMRDMAARYLARTGVCESHYRLHIVPNDRAWLRDSAPTGVIVSDSKGMRREWIGWKFNAWARYDNFGVDTLVSREVAKLSELPWIEAFVGSGASRTPFVLEGGAIETDGEGTLLTTEDCLLSDEQGRNPGLGKADYERAFHEYLGITETIWLGKGIAGDDTHGHIDDLARFIAPGKVVTVYERSPKGTNYKALCENLERLESSTDAKGRKLEVIKLPMPSPLCYDGDELPASYANFYIGNSVVLVPTFNSPTDREALSILADAFPTRQVVGIHAVDLVLGFGTLHCLSQQEPK